MDAAGPGAADADAVESVSSEPTWRERAVERSLRNARAKAMSRSDRFISAAIEILTETGRTDFTVQELIERSKTSLRSFYQHFSGKEELLLALFEEIIVTSASQWRTDVEQLPDSLAGLRYVVEMVHAQAGDPAGGGINRALSVYHLQLAESRPAEYSRVLAPLRELILDLVKRGIDDGEFRDDIDADTLAMIMMQTIVGAAHMHALGSEPGGVELGTEPLWQFCLGGLVGHGPATKPNRRKR
jgi:AcrR family transcriptional regulator